MISAFEQRGIPNPGSRAALAHGCWCAAIDNYHGAGIVMEGELVFWITMGCPLHAPVVDTEPL